MVVRLARARRVSYGVCTHWMDVELAVKTSMNPVDAELTWGLVPSFSSSGPVIMPPPIPSIPENVPATSPTAGSSHKVAVSHLTSRPHSGMSMYRYAHALRSRCFPASRLAATANAAAKTSSGDSIQHHEAM